MPRACLTPPTHAGIPSLARGTIPRTRCGACHPPHAHRILIGACACNQPARSPALHVARAWTAVVLHDGDIHLWEGNHVSGLLSTVLYPCAVSMCCCAVSVCCVRVLCPCAVSVCNIRDLGLISTISPASPQRHAARHTSYAIFWRIPDGALIMLHADWCLLCCALQSFVV